MIEVRRGACSFTCLMRVVWKRKKPGHYSGLLQQHFVFGRVTTPNDQSLTEPNFSACRQCWGHKPEICALEENKKRVRQTIMPAESKAVEEYEASTPDNSRPCSRSVSEKSTSSALRLLPRFPR